MDKIIIFLEMKKTKHMKNLDVEKQKPNLFSIFLKWDTNILRAN